MIRHRITLYNSRESNGDVIKDVGKNSITFELPETYQREDKVTIDEFKHFEYIEKLRIQLINEYDDTGIFSYRYHEGLSVYAQPVIFKENNDKERFYEELNEFVKKLFNIDLTPESWTISYKSLYFHSDIAKTSNLADFMSSKSMIDVGKKLQAVDMVIDDSKIVFKSTQEVNSTITISEQEGVSREVGLFSKEEGISTDNDIVLSGIRVIFARDEEDDGSKAESVNEEEMTREKSNLHRTLFHVNPRHRRHQYGTSAHIEENGLHPILVNVLDENISEPTDDDILECGLFYYLNLDTSVFLDQYQMEESHKLLVFYGTNNLELPEYSLDGWGNEILIQLPDTKEVKLLLHSRYQKPNNEKNETLVQLNSPMIFHACDVRHPHLLSGSPFDNKADIGGSYERFFTDGTAFYHIESDVNKLAVKIPHGFSSIDKIAICTMSVLGLGMFFILFATMCAFKVKRKSAKRKVE